ncbi:MAG: transcriptional regulator, TetR family [Bradyrhizobium sp.]|nr:transcriptional regulator, TetR family [Bradyrhizobium sp.]
MTKRVLTTGKADAKVDAAGVDPARPSRRTRSREATRDKLVEAALRVVSRKGLDGTAIADITEEADVGFGSFYNHFSSKAEIAMSVFERRASKFAEINDMIGAREADTATAVAYIHRLFLTRAVEDPVWGWFVVHTANGLPEMSRVYMTRGKNAIERGVAQGRFSVSCTETAMRIILASLLATMRALLDKDVDGTAVAQTIECLLRMLGVEPAEAKVLSRKKLPNYLNLRFSPDEASA